MESLLLRKADALLMLLVGAPGDGLACSAPQDRGTPLLQKKGSYVWCLTGANPPNYKQPVVNSWTVYFLAQGLFVGGCYL